MMPALMIVTGAAQLAAYGIRVFEGERAIRENREAVRERVAQEMNMLRMREFERAQVTRQLIAQGQQQLTAGGVVGGGMLSVIANAQTLAENRESAADRYETSIRAAGMERELAEFTRKTRFRHATDLFDTVAGAGKSAMLAGGQSVVDKPPATGGATPAAEPTG